MRQSEFWAGDGYIADLVLTGSCGIVDIGDSIDAFDNPLKLEVLPFRNLIGGQLGIIGGWFNVTTAPTSSFTQPDWTGTGPDSTPANYWATGIQTVHVFNQTAAVPSDSGPNTNDLVVSPPSNLRTIYHPRGTNPVLDGKDLSLSMFVYQNPKGITSWRMDFLTFVGFSPVANVTGLSANGTAGVVAYTIPSTGVGNWGTNGFRLNARMTGGASITSGQNFVLCDGFIKANGVAGQTYAQMAFPGYNAAKWTDPANISDANFVNQLQLYQATVCFIKLDENAAGVPESFSTYTANMIALMERCRLANPFMKFVLFSQYDNTAVNQTTLQNLAAAGRALALARSDTLFLDLNASCGASDQIVQASFINASDTVHPNENNTEKLWVIQHQARLLELARAEWRASTQVGSRMTRMCRI